MRLALLTMLAATLLSASDERKLGFEAAAQADFDRVEAGALDLASATACVQSQAMLLSIATPQETAAVAFRKAYCALARATAIQDRRAILQAAESFDDAIADSEAAPDKQKVVQYVPSSRILAAVARLNAGAPAQSEEAPLLSAVDSLDCVASPLTPQRCQSVQQLGSAWLGFIALARGDRSSAARRFEASNAPAWREWLAGLEAFSQGKYIESAAAYARAIAAWRKPRLDSLLARLNPAPDMSAKLAESGGAELLANDINGAIATLDAAVKADPSDARALYLRGVAKEHAGRNDAALDDFELAGRAAFAHAGDAAAAEAHFYRGILLYRRKEFQRAEGEFSSAINAAIPAPWQADARAWRHLSAVSGGACGASRELLERALPSVSPYFPNPEALAAAAACPVTAGAN